MHKHPLAFCGIISGTARCAYTGRSLTHLLDCTERGLAVKVARPCSICGTVALLRRDWCGKHYDRWRRHGDPLYLVPRPTFQERFWAKVNKDGPVPAHCPDLGPCWVWTAATYVAGYGMFGLGGRTDGSQGAHVVSWIMANGPIRDRLRVLHRCDNRPCVRPEHLFLGTQKDNIHDMLKKRRNVDVGAKGTANSNAKFTDQQIVSIRERFASGEKGQTLAAEFGVIPNTISRIVTGKAWAHVGGTLTRRGQGWRSKGEAA
jgi:HNH endonuclease